MLGMLLALVLVGMGAPEDEWLLWAEEGRWDDIIVKASERLDVTESDVEARYWLGRAWLVRGESLVAGTPSAFAQDLAASSLARAIDQLSEVPESRFEDAGEWLLYAEFLRGDAGLAQHLEQLFRDKGRVYAAFLRGRLAQRQGTPGASEWFRLAFEASPKRYDYALALSDELLADGRSEDALAAWRLARDSGSSHATLLPRLLSIFSSPGDADRRLQELDELVSLRDLGEDGLTAWYRSHALGQLGRREEAEAALAGATVNRSFDIDRAHAGLLIDLGREREAVEKMVKWVDGGQRRGSEAALLDVADAVALRGAWSAALTAYDRVLESDPDWERALRNRALTLSRAGEIEASLAAWRHLAERWPDRPDVMNDAALFLDAEGETEEALGLWAAARALSGSEDARENLAAVTLPLEPDIARGLLMGILDTDPTRDRSLFLVHRSRRSGSR